MQFCYSCMHQLTEEEKEQGTCPYCAEALDLSCDTTLYLKPGTMLQGKFVVGKLLGAGGFGNTYIGWNQLLQCKVAIKEYFPRHLSTRKDENVTVTITDTENQKRFRTGLNQFMEEARNLATLQDVKGVTQVYTFFEENGTGYIIMEFLEGKDIKTILEQRHNHVDYDWSRRVILTVLHTLREIHAKGILHRDIAPDNIYVTNEGVIKLIDFGAAKHSAESVSEKAEIVLKAGYAPIEQYSRLTQQGPYTDLYAVAALFYRMLTGAKPQPANERMKDDKLQTLSDLGIAIPEQAEMAIMICLNLQPKFRLQSAEEFMEALEGKYFEPVYEPEWILPEQEEESLSAVNRLGDSMQKLPFVVKTGVLIGLLLLIGGGIGFIYMAGGAKKTDKVVSDSQDILPACEGESEADAVASLQKYGITPEITYRYNEEQEENQVVEMEPAAGTRISEKSTVKLTIESSTLVTVPDYTGENQTDIEKSLTETLGERYDSKIFVYDYTTGSEKKDICYGQTSIGTIELDKLEEFQIMISWGTKESYEVKMPDLSGKTLSEARDILRQEGLSMTIAVKKEVYNSSYSSGEIISQTVKKSTKLNTNQADKNNYSVPKKVEVVVSKGAKPKPTPTPSPKVTPKPAEKPKSTPVPTPKATPRKDSPLDNIPKKKNNDSAPM